MISKIIIKYIIIILFVLTIISCDKEGGLYCFQKSGNITSETYPLPDFDTIVFDDVFHVYLNQDTINYITINGFENLVPSIKYTVENKTLRIQNTNMCLWTKPKKNKITLTINFSNISRIDVGKSCKIRSVNTITGEKFGLVLKDKLQDVHLKLNVDEFYFWNDFPCGGVLKLEGNTNILTLWSTALIHIDAQNLNSKIAKVESDARSDMHIRVLEELYCTIKHIGNIYYYGNPDIIEFTDKGDGMLIKAE